MRGGVFNRLQKLRERREQQAASEKERARQEMLNAHSQLVELKKRHALFVAQAKKEIAQFWLETLREPVSVHEINKIRGHEAWLEKKKAEMTVEVGRGEEFLAQKKEQFQEKTQEHQRARIHLEKITFLTDREEAIKKREKEEFEEKEREEFTLPLRHGEMI